MPLKCRNTINQCIMSHITLLKLSQLKSSEVLKIISSWGNFLIFFKIVKWIYLNGGICCENRAWTLHDVNKCKTRIFRRNLKAKKQHRLWAPPSYCPTKKQSWVTRSQTHPGKYTKGRTLYLCRFTYRGIEEARKGLDSCETMGTLWGMGWPC